MQELLQYLTIADLCILPVVLGLAVGEWRKNYWAGGAVTLFCYWVMLLLEVYVVK